MRRAPERPRLRVGIRFRLTVGLLLIAAAGCALLYALAMNRLDRSVEASVTEDLESLQSATTVYVRQFLLLEERNNDEESFRSAAQAIAEELYTTNRRPLALYTLSGEYLLGLGGANAPRRQAGGADAAFQSALEGRAAYTLHYGADRTLTAEFFMPLTIAEEAIGLIAYALDYTSLFRRYDQLAHTLLLGTMAVLVLICGVVLLYLHHILTPIRHLSGLSTRVAAQMRKGVLPAPEEPERRGGRHAPRKARRPALLRDEVSELSENYDRMLRTVGEQFTRIQEDRVRILQLLDSRQAFYNNVTHELKTPLTTIQGYAQLLEQAGAGDEELFSRGLAHIQHESARLHRMVIQLLEMSDIDRSAPLEPVDCAAVLRSVAQSMALKAVRYGCSIRFAGEDALPIRGQEERVRQLCINLIDNAIKYGAPGETIWAEADRSDGRAVLRVINRGPGFSDEEAQRLFEPFYRVDKAHSREMGSAGLGLSICKKIVKEHGGSIRARSRGGYTVFEVRFPLGEEKPEGGVQP
ncbi:MAG: sensor histidine kinase [Candidatus Spyradocola sp.]|jgi:signal transduction histidine kinase